ncbi:MAG: 50S ribosomal protein L17 [Chitinophagales bacterium]
MRHRNKINALGRETQHRKALLRNLAISLIEMKHITTTTAKAKELRRYVEPLLTRAKDDSTHNRRIVFSMLRHKQSISTLFGEVAEKIGDRPGGYTRVIKIGNRPGDNADMAMIELVDFSLLNSGAEGSVASAEATPKKRTRRGTKKPASTKTDIRTDSRKGEKKPSTKTSNAPKIRQRKSGDS